VWGYILEYIYAKLRLSWVKENAFFLLLVCVYICMYNFFSPIININNTWNKYIKLIYMRKLVCFFKHSIKSASFNSILVRLNKRRRETRNLHKNTHRRRKRWAFMSFYFFFSNGYLFSLFNRRTSNKEINKSYIYT